MYADEGAPWDWEPTDDELEAMYHEQNRARVARSRELGALGPNDDRDYIPEGERDAQYL